MIGLDSVRSVDSYDTGTMVLSELDAWLFCETGGRFIASGRPRVTMGYSTDEGVAGVGIEVGRTTGRHVSAFARWDDRKDRTIRPPASKRLMAHSLASGSGLISIDFAQ